MAQPSDTDFRRSEAPGDNDKFGAGLLCQATDLGARLEAAELERLVVRQR